MTSTDRTPTLKSRAGFGDDYRVVLLNNRPIGRVRRVDGQWRGFTKFTNNTPARRELGNTPAAVCDTAEEAASAVAAQYTAENS